MIVKDNQNMYDIVVQEFGDIEKLFVFLNDNTLSLGDFLSSGQEVIINNEREGNETIKEYFLNNNIKLMNNQGANLPPILAGAYSSAYSNDYN